MYSLTESVGYDMSIGGEGEADQSEKRLTVNQDFMDQAFIQHPSAVEIFTLSDKALHAKPGHKP